MAKFVNTKSAVNSPNYLIDTLDQQKSGERLWPWYFQYDKVDNTEPDRDYVLVDVCRNWEEM